MHHNAESQDTTGSQLTAVSDIPQVESIKTPQVLPFKVATFNTHYDNTGLVGEEVVSLMKTEGIEIIGLQELHFLKQRDNVSKVLCGSKIYDCFMPTYTKGGSSPTSYTIAWDSRKFEAIGEGVVIPMVDRIDHPKKPGVYFTARHATMTHLRQKETGKDVYVLNTHTMPGVQAPEGGLREDSTTVASYREHMKKLKGVVDELVKTGANVLLVGDFNFDNLKDNGSVPFAPKAFAAKTGLLDAFSVVDGTATTLTKSDGSNVAVDYVFSGGKIKPVAAYAVKNKYGSDHHPFVALVTESEVSGWAQPERPSPLPAAAILSKYAPNPGSTQEPNERT